MSAAMDLLECGHMLSAGAVSEKGSNKDGGLEEGGVCYRAF